MLENGHLSSLLSQHLIIIQFIIFGIVVLSITLQSDIWLICQNKSCFCPASSSFLVFNGTLLPQTSSRYDRVTLFRGFGSLDKVQCEYKLCYISIKLNAIIMKLKTHVLHGIWRVCTKFGENRTIGGTIIKVYLESRI